MDETEFRIIDALSRDPDRQLSISALTSDIAQLHGTAYYANIHRILDRLHEEGVVSIAKAGNSSLVCLDLRNRQTIDALSEMELHKRRTLLAGSERMRRLFDSFSGAPLPGQALLIDAERNLKLNRAELLVVLPVLASGKEMSEAISDSLRGLEGRLNTRIDALILDHAGFDSLLARRDGNRLREMLSRQTVLLAPDLFWNAIRNAWSQGIRIHFEREEINPARIPEEDLMHNLARFGYTELGSRVGEGRDLGIETIVTALLMKGDARRVQAIPVLLAKNEANYPLLLFLSKKHSVEGRLLGLLKALCSCRPSPDLQSAIMLMEKAHVVEVETSRKSIEKVMRTYNALA